MAVALAPASRRAHAFIEFLRPRRAKITDRGSTQLLKYKVRAPDPPREKAVQLTAGIRSFYDIQAGAATPRPYRKSGTGGNAYFGRRLPKRKEPEEIAGSPDLLEGFVISGLADHCPIKVER
jgi:hypothetical protein